MIRFAAIGTASTGKSAVLNALFGTRFSVDARARSTSADETTTTDFEGARIEIVDSAPLEKVFTRMNADAYLLVCDKDLTDIERNQLVCIPRPCAVAVNKADTYNRAQLRQLLLQIRLRLRDLLPPERVVSCAADPVRIVYRHTADGSTLERTEPIQPDMGDLMDVARDLVDEAEMSIRVRTREVVRKSRVAALKWFRDRNF